MNKTLVHQKLWKKNDHFCIAYVIHINLKTNIAMIEMIGNNNHSFEEIEVSGQTRVYEVNKEILLRDFEPIKQSYIGYYSIIQYMPDVWSRDAIAVGLCIVCPDLDFIFARAIESNDRVKALWPDVDEWFLDQIKNGIVYSINNNHQNQLDEENNFDTLEKFKHYTQCLGNDIKMTEPRGMRIEDPMVDFERMFAYFPIRKHLREN